MKPFICPRCGQTSCSAAEPANQVDPSCPYCGHNEAAPVSKTETARDENTATDYTIGLRGLPSGFICDNCNQWFNDPLQQLEYHGFADGLPEETWVSPCCHYSYATSYECQKCGATIPESQSAYGLCADCERKALWRLKWYLANEFDRRERAYLDACVEGESLIDPEKIKPVLAS